MKQDLIDQNESLLVEIDDLKDNFKKLKSFNEELRDLVEQERAASIEEKEGLEQKIEN